MVVRKISQIDKIERGFAIIVKQITVHWLTMLGRTLTTWTIAKFITMSAKHFCPLHPSIGVTKSSQETDGTTLLLREETQQDQPQ